jgi:TPR repeat protein
LQCPEGQYLCGFCFENGLGVSMNSGLAVHNFKLAMARSHPLAMCRYGICLLRGFGVHRNLAEAADLFRRSGELGCALGLYYYARCLEYGEGVIQNDQEAVRLYRSAAREGEPAALAALGIAAASGKFGVVDLGEAAKYFRAAADSGDGVGQFCYACCLLRGDGVANDEGEAVRLFRDVYTRRAVMWEDHDGQIECANNGPIEQFASAMDARMANGKSDETIELYRSVKALKSNPSAAFRSLQELAEKRHHGANFHLGMCFLNGIGGNEDHGRAIQCLKRAASWDCIYMRAMTAPREEYAFTPRRTTRAVRMTKKSVTVHHASLVREDGARSYIWA